MDGAIARESLKINEIYVDDKYRGQGVGRRLLEEIISLAQARSNKVRRVVFHTEPDNLAMRRLAEKLGFELKALTYEKELWLKVPGERLPSPEVRDPGGGGGAM